MIKGILNSASSTSEIIIHAGDQDHQVLIYGLSPISYKFDLTPDQVEIDSLMVLHQTMNIDIDRYDAQRRDLYTILRSIEGCKVEFIITSYDRQVYNFKFKYERSGMSLKDKGTEINLKLSSWYNENITSGEIFDAIPSKMPFRRIAKPVLTGSSFDPGSFNYNAVGVGNWISKSMELIFENPNSVVRSAETGMGVNFTEFLFGDLPGYSQTGFVMVDMPDLFFAPTDEGKQIIAGTGTLTWTIEYTDLQNGVPVYILRLNGTATQFLDDIIVGDEIESGTYLGQVINRDSNTVIYTIIEQNLYTEPHALARPFFIARAPRPRMIPALGVLKKMAATEGSLFGYGFGQNFYINRLRRDPEQRIAIPWSEVEDCQVLHINKPLSESYVSTIVDGEEYGTELFGAWRAPASNLNRRIPNLLPYKSIIRGNKNGLKSLKISIPVGYPFLCKGFRLGEIIDADANSSYLDNDITLESALTQVGIKSHYKSISITDDELLIDFEFLSAFLVKPWQTFYFVGAPEEFDGKEFRLTEIDYDVYGNRSFGKAYQIDTVESQVIPEKISNLGLDFQFGNKMLPQGLIAPVNNILANGLRHIATFVTSEPLSGLISEVEIIRAPGDTTAIPMGYKFTVVNPALISQTQEFEILENLAGDSTLIKVVPQNYAGTFPAGSFIYVSNRSIMTGILLGEFGINLLSKNLGSVGVLTNAVNGSEVTELPVDLWSSVPQGRSLFLIDILSNTSVNIQTTGAVGSGPGTMAIEEQLISMPAGALIYHDGAQLQSLLNMDPGHIHLKVIREEKANAIGEIATGHAAGIVNQLDCIITRSNSLQQGQLLRVSNQDGTGETFVVPEDFQIIAYETIGIPVVEKTTTVDLLGGATVQVPAANINSRITVTASQVSIISQYLSENSAAIESIASIETRVSASEAQVVMKALVSGGNITKLSLVALTASASSGSAVNILADQVNVTGQSNFFSSLYAGGVASETFAETYADTQRNQARNNIAAQLGYTNYSAMVDEALLGRTIINGGYLNTELLNVTWLFAQTASVTGGLTLGASSGFISHASGKWNLDNNGIYLGAGQGSYDQATALRIGNRIRIYGVDGFAEDGAYFEMYGNTFMKFDIDGDLVFDVATGKTVSFNRPIANSAAASADNHLLRRLDGDGRYYQQSTADSRFVRTTNTNQSVQGVKTWVNRQDFRSNIRVYNSNDTNYADLEYSGGSGNRVVRIPQFAQSTVNLVAGDEQDGSVTPNTRLRFYVGSDLYYVSAEKFM